jgi:putative membrane-bound dehydrogenase-like protein
MRRELPVLMILGMIVAWAMSGGVQAQRGGPLPPEQALAAMQVAPGFQVELFAAEPLLMNPTSIDVDHRGRVWVAEAVNYRRVGFQRPLLRPEGDRIVVLIDRNGDGRADDAVTFYQGKELIAPLSVLVLPQPPDGQVLRVLVAQSPDILEFWDRDGDLKADGPPRKFLTGFRGFDHDHGVHGLTVGPDGRLYFTVGDSGVAGLQSADGQGRRWTSNATDCRAGTVWRCHLDGTHLELLAHNFRNNYEACVDSFGEIWLSDNDDDGNQQTRICFVLPGGNYGYHPRGPGQSHWHEEQPGIVHKVLRTGFGSPTGITVYEGNLFGPKYTGVLLHCDAGPREVRAFFRKPRGAGYELDKEILLTSRDNWFRPSDVCVAPDGSIFIADWYDRGVGGHGMGDPFDGRIYRLTPQGHKGYTVPPLQCRSLAEQLQALASPNSATRVLAMTAVREARRHKPAEEPLRLESAPLWLQARLALLEDGSEAGRRQTLRLLHQQWQAPPATSALRAALIRRIAAWAPQGQLPPWEQLGLDLARIAEQPPDVRRELLLLLAHYPADVAQAPFYALARCYSGNDHFYRAALNIALGTEPKRRAAILADFDRHFPQWNDAVADLVWELRPPSVLPRLGQLLREANLSASQKARILDIIAVQEDPAAGRTLLQLLQENAASEVKARALEHLRRGLAGPWKPLQTSEDLQRTIQTLLQQPDRQATGLQLIAAAQALPFVEKVAVLARDPSVPEAVRVEAIRTLGQLPSPASVAALTALCQSSAVSSPLAAESVQALGALLPRGTASSPVAQQALSALQQLVLQESAAVALRSAALSALAGSRPGTVWLLDLHQQGKLPKDLIPEAGRLLRNSPFQAERNRALLLFPPPGKLNPKNLPPISTLVQRQGDPARGRLVWNASLTGAAQCAKCHSIRGSGGQVGPDLSMIGKKASRENLYESILFPSKAIADQYIQYQVTTTSEVTLSGLLMADTPEAIILRDANGKDVTIPKKEIDGPIRKLPVSLMPEDIVAALTEEELVDLVAYLETLKTPVLTPPAAYVAGPFPAPSMTAALDKPFGPETQPFDPQQRFGAVAWRVFSSDARGYFDLAALHGSKANQSASYLYWEIDSPREQPAEILLGSDDGARLWLNGQAVFRTQATRAAAPEQDRLKVTLRKGKNTLLLKVANGDGPHGAYLSLIAEEELRLFRPSSR